MGISLSRATKVVPLCVNLDLKAEHDRAVRALDDARRVAAQDEREVSTGVRDAAEAVREIERRMQEHTLQFTLQALPRKAWAEFEATHPPREGNDLDQTLGVDVSQLDGPIAESILSVQARDGSSVDFDAATEWQGLADEMSTAQWNDFAQAVLALNNGVTAAPFSPAASLAILRSEQTSKRPSA